MTIAKENLIIGSGIFLIDIKDPNTGLYSGHFTRMGNMTELTAEAEVETVDHYDSEHAAKAKDKSIDTRTTPTLAFSVDEMSPENQAFGDYAIVEDVLQAAVDDNALVITGAQPLTYHPLDKKFIGIQTLGYDTGTGLFVVGEVVTGAGGAVGTVVQVVGDITSGVLYLKTLNGTAFVDDEVLTGSIAGIAAANGIKALVTTAVSIEDADNPGTFLSAGVDYSIDPTYGYILFTASGYCDGLTKLNFNVVYANQEKTLKKIKGFTVTELYARVWFISDNTTGSNLEFKTWDGQLRPSGGSSLIGDDWQTKGFTYEVYPDYVNHADSPFWDKFVYGESA
jgi:hypothetical protein